MTKGIVYTIWGNNQKIINHLYSSNKRSKKLGYKTCIIHDPKSHINTNLFTKAIECEPLWQGLANKSIWGEIKNFPFDLCLFLDCDAFVIHNIDYGFEMAAKWGIALTIAPASSLHYALPMNDRSNVKMKEWIQYNTGAIFVNTNDHIAVKTLRTYSYLLMNNNLAIQNDQPFFTIAMNNNNINPYVLPCTWNLRQHITQGKVHGEIKIWHGQYPKQDLTNFPLQGLYKIPT